MTTYQNLDSVTITNWYLYGVGEVPETLHDPSLVRNSYSNSTIQVDLDAFMTEGDGRFIRGINWCV